ncbi:hypothetical protein [Nonomuraea sp. NPDC003709]
MIARHGSRAATAELGQGLKMGHDDGMTTTEVDVPAEPAGGETRIRGF